MQHATIAASRPRRPSRRRQHSSTARAATAAPVQATQPDQPDHTASSEAVDGRGFADLGVPPALVSALAEAGIHTPFPIQTATLPDAIAGRDILGRGRTGSGKTVSFAVPTVTRLAASGTPAVAGKPRALVLVPTRELASQVAATFAPLAAAAGLTVTTVYGGVGQNAQVRALRAGVDVLIACPGRLEDLIGQGRCRLDRVEVTVIDEADYMADLGFLPGVKRLLDQTRAGTQRMLYSATLDNAVDVLVRRYLDAPATHSVNPAVAPVSAVAHHVLTVRADVKNAVVRELAAGMGRTLLFTRTKHTAKRVAKQLTAAGVPALDLHGNLAQRARERNLMAFADGEVRVLVATDIAARGIHVDDIDLVVHVDPPAEHKAYLHRSGRTARAGAGGVVVTLATHVQLAEVRTLAKRAGVAPTIATVAPGDPAIGVLTGPAAPYVEPAGRTSAGRTTAGGGAAAQGRSGHGGAGSPKRAVRPARAARRRRRGGSAPSSRSPRSS